jgi:K+-transporting ATPase KdpF subunit
MALDDWIGGLVSVAIAAYLFYALFRPERF